MGKNEFSRRVDRIQAQVCPPRFAGIEEILKRIHLEGQKDLNDQEKRLLAELKSLPVHPELERKLEEIERGRTHVNQANRIS